MTTIFRRATHADIPHIVPMMTTFNDEELIEFTPEKGASGLDALLHNPGWGFVLVAGEDDALTGYALIAYGFDIEFGGRDAFLCELFVAEPYRGTGLGRALLEAAEAQAKDHGVNALHLIVRQENARARGLYERRGFIVDPRLLMTKSLDGEL
ncbi:MAG: GNAT family N-acetyltransferase [Myxococcota bacterium]